MKKILTVLVLLLLCVLAGAASAQAPAKDPDGFEPVASDMMQKGESLPASRLVAGAYGFIFAALVVYVASVAARARRIEDEIDELKRKLDAKGH